MKSFVSQQDAKLHRILIACLQQQYSSKKIKELLDSARVRVNGKIELFGSVFVKKGTFIEVNDQPLPKIRFDPSRVLYEDDALFIYHKPPGLECAETVIHHFFSKKYWLGHRLDKMTSGVLILCKSVKVAELLKKAFQAKSIQKTYFALVDGITKKASGHIETHLGKVAKIPGQTIYGKVQSKAGKLAILDYRVLATKNKSCFVAIYPLTGRTHQIRVQMAAVGHPIILDPLYGSYYQSKYFAPRTMLHCYEMKLVHPITQKPLSITAPLEQDFVMALKELGFSNHIDQFDSVSNRDV